MSSVINRGDSTKLIEQNPIDTIHGCVVGSEAGAEEIQLGGKRTFAFVKRDILEEAAKVVIDFRLALGERVNSYAYARRPLIGEAIVHHSVVAHYPLLLGAKAQIGGDILVNAPDILPIERVVVRACVKWRPTILTSNLTQVDGHVTQAGHRH